ncbi:hypothetical protein N7457_008621 [Penicillium paradoxum]|uniref:uncharacterized protein n=1 Tax=Penicillium paradoxum TaxID=176176 RepID=UPI0025487CB7|nr:uncharacterized protein N7457_008621 [Penicillium paradoxum]KAJ5773725.1 hypothetical protein N7457_008621 [Penicillium paradoxum]
MSRVYLRPACAQDLPSIADLAAQAMVEDELFIHLCPHRYEHYADFRYGFVRRLKKRLVTPGYIIMVAVEQEGQGVGEVILLSPYVLPMVLPLTPPSALERKLLALEDSYLALICPDRSVDPHRLAHYTASISDCFPFADYPDMWFLATLAVDPTFQRRGIGQQLVHWGLQQAVRDNVSVGLEASVKGTGLYEKLGFRTINTLELMPGIIIRAMLYDQPLPSEQIHP